jgi:hypothetical protein
MTTMCHTNILSAYQVCKMSQKQMEKAGCTDCESNCIRNTIGHLQAREHKISWGILMSVSHQLRQNHMKGEPFSWLTLCLH